MYTNLARELKKNTIVMDSTFRKFNLQVLQFAYHPCSDDDADCELIIELAAIEDDSVNEDVSIKINLYDSNGEIIDTCYEDIYADEFSGYDTYKISLYNSGKTLLMVKSARIYISKS